MFEIKTQEALLEDLLELVPDTTNKGVGSLVYTTLAAMAEKMEEIYIDLAEATENTFADTADREHLIRRAAERGLEPDPATPATYLAYFNCEVDLGDRFEQDEYTLVVLERIEDENHEFAYKLETEQTGSDTNTLSGELDYLEGDNPYIEEAYIYELLIPAADEQDTELFRAEYMENAKVAAFGGNVQSYIKAMNDISGVGAAKVEGVNNGVRIVFLDSQYSSPNAELIRKVQNVIDPTTDVNNWCQEYGLPEMEDYSGMGFGLAPINHSVLCEGPEVITVNVRVNVVLESGFVLEDLQDVLETTINDYMLSLRKKWKNKVNQSVSKNRLMARLLEVEGVADIDAILFNNNALNISLEYDQIPVVGTIQFLID